MPRSTVRLVGLQLRRRMRVSSRRGPANRGIGGDKMASNRWDTGIEIIGDLAAWGTHFCVFYETKEDLLDTMISYYKLGLERGEYCLWVVAEPITIEEATHVLKEAVPDLDRYLADSSLEFTAARDWFLQGGEFDGKRVSSQFQEKLALASARGYPGMRVSGDTTWLKKDWRHFCDWEDGLNDEFGNHHIAGLCSYPLAACGALEILDVLRAHQFALVRRRGSWDVFETAGLKQAKAEIKRLNEGLEKRVEERTKELAAANEKLQSAFNEIETLKDQLQRENVALREEINHVSMFEDIVGSSEPLRNVLHQLRKVAPSDSTVLILGETGTGKELIARAIHKQSSRSPRAFIAVNCAAIPQSLIASELFGHEKGAFTGATERRIGRFEAANGGTIFLDEVGDLPAEVQISLLRVLQEREVERVGSNKPMPVDVRVLAATHHDLEKLVSDGKFRQDLLYRLNVVPIEMPSLRERAADIPLLVEYFIARFGKKAGKKFKAIAKNSLKLLQEYEWPGNVRELQNVIERAVILSDSDTFAVDETWLRREGSELPQVTRLLNGALLQQERGIIEGALAATHGRVAGPAGAAAKLGVPTRTLDSKIKRLGIDKYRFKSNVA